MSNHHLTRTPHNEPVCSCGLRPDILDTDAPVGRLWKAKAIVQAHIEAMNAEQDTTTPTRSPDAPFTSVRDAKYPRAGVRLMPSGKWLLSLWDGDEILHVFDEPEFDDRKTAFDYGWLTIGACRQSGTNLNGMEAA
jgi:hypothetical protein